MKNRLTKISGKLLSIILLAVMMVPHFTANAEEPCDESIIIEPAPYIINLHSNMEIFVIHTNMYYWDVDPETVTVNGVLPFAWKIDDLLQYDALVMLEDLLLSDEADPVLVAGEYNTLTLRGNYQEESVCGSKNLLVTDKGIGTGKIMVK